MGERAKIRIKGNKRGGRDVTVESGTVYTDGRRIVTRDGKVIESTSGGRAVYVTDGDMEITIED